MPESEDGPKPEGAAGRGLGTRVWEDVRALASLDDASGELVGLWRTAVRITGAAPPPTGLAAGERPAADVEVLAGVAAAVEFELARRMHTARAAGGLPLHDPGAMLAARGWSSATARRLARAGALAADHAGLAAAWAAGVITSEHVDAVARRAERFTAQELAAVIEELDAHWGRWSPPAIARFVDAADRLLHPPQDPTGDEADAYESRSLSFSLLGDTVLLAGSLPRVEGELVIAAIDALAERLRSTADHVPAGARRADALVELVNAAHTAGALPSRGGLPVALTVTLDHTALGEPLWTTGRAHHLTAAEQRWAACHAEVTPMAVARPECPDPAAAPHGASVGCSGARGDAAEPDVPAPRQWGADRPQASTPPPDAGHGHADAHPGDEAPQHAEAHPPDAAPQHAEFHPGDAAAQHDAPGQRRSDPPRPEVTADAARPPDGAPPAPPPAPDPTPAARIAALAVLLFDARVPLAVGRTQRTATPAQRRALAVRDGGCIMPGCSVPAHACQVHHLTEWAEGGATDVSNLVSLCWSHHRQVDLRMWRVLPGRPDAPAVDQGEAPGTPWPANHAAPFTIVRTSRREWRA